MPKLLKPFYDCRDSHWSFAMDNQYHDDGGLAGDILVGATAIRRFLEHLGMPGADPYYLKRSKQGWPIGNTAGVDGRIIASKKRLVRFLDKLTRGPDAV